MSKTLYSNVVGVDLAPSEFTITARRLMSYAAALGATEDVYLNDLRPEGIIGLPTFIISPEWRVMNGPAYRGVLGAGDEQMWRCIHVRQDSRLFAPLRPEQRIVTKGKISVLRKTRIGAYIAVRLDTTLADTGQDIAQSWFCGIFLGDDVAGDDRSIVEPPDVPTILNTDSLVISPEPYLTISRALPHLYTEAADIWNPIHTERSAARGAGLDDTLLHGSCSWGAAGLQIIRQFCGGDPARLRRLGARMSGKALVGDSLFLRSQADPRPVAGGVEVLFDVVNAEGKPVLSDGIAEIASAL